MSDLKYFTKTYKRISDGRIFLCRNITAKECKMYDTVEKTFEAMGTTKRSRFYKHCDGRTYHHTPKNQPRVSGAKVRDLRRNGFKTNGSAAEWDERF